MTGCQPYVTPIHYNPFNPSGLSRELTADPCPDVLIQLWAGQFVLKDTMRDNIRIFAEIQEDFMYWLS